jgi:pimeloyl-ACP methyl ester carboxylesterase
VIHESDVPFEDGTLHVYDAGPRDGHVVVWHHGTPNIGTPPEPLFEASDRLGLRWVSYDRPGYGGSTAVPDRSVGTAATYTAAVADELGIDRFAVMGHSGGSAHGLACGALLPDRVVAVVGMAALAPPGADGLDWFAGMADGCAASLQAGMAGREAKVRHEASADPDADIGFNREDWEALESDWSWFGGVVGPALAGGQSGPIDDDLAYVSPWGCDPSRVTAPVLLVHGDRDRMVPSAHSRWLARTCPSSELWIRPDDGHITVLRSGQAALEWLRQRFT